MSIMCHSEAHKFQRFIPKGVEVRVLADEDSLQIHLNVGSVHVTPYTPMTPNPFCGPESRSPQLELSP